MITAIELRYRSLLKGLENQMIEASRRCEEFIDLTLCNHEVTDYLISLGYKIKEVRYETIDGEYGYHGRDTGDGTVKTRISW